MQFTMKKGCAIGAAACAVMVAVLKNVESMQDMEFLMKDMQKLQAGLLMVIAVLLGAIVWSMLKCLHVLKDMQYNLQWAASCTCKCVEKLTFLEKRMENLTQSGMETARHLSQLCADFDMKLSKGSLRFALRSTVEIYSTWRAARIFLKQSCSKQAWQLVVKSAKLWVEGEVENLQGAFDEDSLEMKERLETNLKMFVKYMPQWWGGDNVEDPMVEFSKMENLQLVKMGLLETANDAHEWSSGVSFRSRRLKEPNAGLNLWRQ